MLREDSVAYSSLPQDEGSTPSSSFVTSRPATNIHNRRDCQVAAIITSLVIVTGITLAATLPLILKSKSKDLKSSINDVTDDDYDFWNSHLNVGGDNSMTIEEPVYIFNGSHDHDLVSSSGTQTSIPVVVVATTKPPSAPVKNTSAEVKNATVVSVAVSVLSIHEGDNADGDNADGAKESVVSLGEDEWPTSINEGNGMMATEGKYDFGGNTSSEVGGDKDSEMGGNTNAEVGGGEVNKTVTGSVENGKLDGSEKEGSLTTAKSKSIQLPSTHDPHNAVDYDMNQLLNEIYGEQGHAKPSSLDNDSMMNTVLSTRDKTTLVVLAAVVAVALATVIAAIGWLVHTRIVARRRRQNIQNVITDLQSRDKIVLLNSEESEEEE